jgi:hypothetical protein
MTAMKPLKAYLINNNLTVNAFACKEGLRQTTAWRIKEPAKESPRSLVPFTSKRTLGAQYHAKDFCTVKSITIATDGVILGRVSTI